MRSASCLCERPENTISRFCGPRSIQWPVCGCATSCGSRPGRTSSGLAPAGCIPLLVLLTRPRDCERVGGDVLRYHRSGSDPSTVPDLDGRDEAIVDPGPDVAPDRGAAFRLAGRMREVGGDRAGPDVRVLADLRVADVRQVRHFRAVADP